MGKGKGKKHDDLSAVRTIVDALQAFDDEIRDRILRWAREKLDTIEAQHQRSRSSPKANGGGKASAAKARTKAKASAKKRKKKKKKKPTKKKAPTRDDAPRTSTS